MLTFNKVSGSACKADYVVPELDNLPIKFWIIVGGTPCISYGDYSFSKRFDNNKIAKYGDGMYIHPNYLHQDHKGNPHPSLSDDLPNGEIDVYNWLQDTYYSYLLRNERYAMLPVRYMQSKRLHWIEDHSYFHCEITIRSHYMPVVTVSSEADRYAGRFLELIRQYASKAWRDLNWFTTVYENYTLEQLNNVEFESLCTLLAAVQAESL